MGQTQRDVSGSVWTRLSSPKLCSSEQAGDGQGTGRGGAGDGRGHGSAPCPLLLRPLQTTSHGRHQRDGFCP